MNRADFLKLTPDQIRSYLREREIAVFGRLCEKPVRSTSRSPQDWAALLQREGQEIYDRLRAEEGARFRT